MPAYLAGSSKKDRPKANVQLLKKLEAEKARIQELRQTPEGQEQLRNEKFDLALRKAQGEKVKDDPNRVKKSLKRREKHKEKAQMATCVLLVFC